MSVSDCYDPIMLAHQRDEMILERLRASGSVSAAELGALLRVSAPTVRRDLERLEHEGALQRVHGGAYLADDTATESAVEAAFGSVVDENALAKDAVAAQAASVVEDGQVVLLDIGTTTMRIAHHLRGRDVTVITSSLAVLDVLRHDTAVNLVLLGGAVRRNFQTLVGPFTEDNLADVTADLAILSCTGVRPDGTIVDDISREATIKRAMIRAADRIVLAAPASKFPGSGSLRISSLADIDILVTTSDAPRTTTDLIRQFGGELMEV